LFFIGVVAGVVVGVVLSLLLLIAAASKSPIRRMAFDSAARMHVDADTHPDATMPDGVLVAEIDGPLFFADAAELRKELREMAEESGATAVVVDLGAAADIDLDRADIITKVAGEFSKNGVRLVLARVDAAKMGLLERGYA
jgi:MFS superfamily sulfate permease-like transporter